MKKRIYFPVMAVAAMMFAACSNEELPQQPVADEIADTPILINAGVADLTTRAGYEAGPLKEGTMGFYMQTAGTESLATPNNYNASNKKITYTDGKWVVDGTLLWKDGSSNVTWQAYYPYDDTNITDGIITINIPTDQAKDGVCDFLYAQSEEPIKGQDYKEGININLKHQMSKLIINLTAGTALAEELGNVEYESVLLTDIITQDQFNISNTGQYNKGYFIFQGDNEQNINMIKHDDGTTFEAIILPTTNTFGVEITLKDGRKFYYKNGNSEFEYGHIHTLNLKVGKDKVETTSFAVKSWTAGNDQGEDLIID